MPEEKTKYVKYTFRLPSDLIEWLRDAAYEDRRSLNEMAAEALEAWLNHQEKVVRRGRQYPARAGDIQRGRRVGR
jgi:hypothetical protein